MLTLAIAVFLAGVAGRSSAQTTPDDVLNRLKGQKLYLRGKWQDNKLKFNSDGSPVKPYKQLPFTECGHLGLDEKAVEAVSHYKFPPATRNGTPVKVDLYIDINFQIF